MRQRYILYAQTMPFPGSIVGFGWVDDVDQKPDGSTVAEYLQKRMKRNPDLGLHVGTLEVKDSKTQKFDPATKAVVDQTAADMTPPKQEVDVTLEAEKQAAIDEILAEVKEAEKTIDSITTIAATKVFLRKLVQSVSRVVVSLSAKNAGA